MNRIVCTLDPHRLGPGLVLSQGNLVVSCAGSDISYPAMFARAVFGTIAIAAGRVAFECSFWSTSRPAAGLSNLCSVGVAEVTEPLNQFVGHGALSYGYRPTEAQVWNNNADISTGVAAPALQPVAERQKIGVLLDCTGANPICSWQVNGSYIFQTQLHPSKFYVPAVSIGSTTPGDVSAEFNFGQFLFWYPFFSVSQ